MPFVPAQQSPTDGPNLGCSEAAHGRARLLSPPPTGAVQPHGSAVPLPHGGGGSLHPDAGRVLDADATHPRPLRLTDDEADAVAVVADSLASKHGGAYLAWVAAVLNDIRTGYRDRSGGRVWQGDAP